MKTELQQIEEDLNRVGTYRVKHINVADATEYFAKQDIDNLVPTLIKGMSALEYTITVIVTPYVEVS